MNKLLEENFIKLYKELQEEAGLSSEEVINLLTKTVKKELTPEDRYIFEKNR